MTVVPSLMYLLFSSFILLSDVMCASGMKNVVVVGAGLAGLSASLSAFEKGANVTLIDGEKGVGGNSAKATSGINGCQTSSQAMLSVQDSNDLFFNDTVKAGHNINNEELVWMLVSDSAAAIDRLKSIGVDLSDLVILGGHSVKRTHRIPSKGGKPMPVGFSIVGAVKARLQQLAEAEPSRLRILTSTRATDLLTDGDVVVGIRVRNETSAAEVWSIDADSVVLTTGGFSNDHSDTSLLQQYAADKAHYPTTNGPFATGSGLKMALKVGAKTVDMTKVQIHPTGFVDPSAPGDKTKFLAAEALRGSGAILLADDGRRFVDELAARDYVTEQIEKHCALDDQVAGHVALMLLNDAAVQQFGLPSFNFYWKVKKFFQRLNNGSELAAYLNVSADTLKAELDAYNASAAKGKDPFGKVTFPTVFGWDDAFYVARITPVIHYTMGGIAINNRTNVLRTDGTVIAGLYAAGEVTGGVHGANRLGGNSLLECAVFGHRAGIEASAGGSSNNAAIHCYGSVVPLMLLFLIMSTSVSWQL